MGMRLCWAFDNIVFRLVYADQSTCFCNFLLGPRNVDTSDIVVPMSITMYYSANNDTNHRHGVEITVKNRELSERIYIFKIIGRISIGQ